MKRRLLPLLFGAAIGAVSCQRGPGTSPPLRPAERTLVDLYVDIARAEALRMDQPDSVGPILDRLAQHADSAVVQSALRGLKEDPSRWALVYDEIAQKLRAIEESTDPRLRQPGAQAPPVPRVSD